MMLHAQSKLLSLMSPPSPSPSTPLSPSPSPSSPSPPTPLTPLTPSRRIFLITVTVAAAAITAACGFSLRAGISWPPQLANVHVTGGDRELIAQLQNALPAHDDKVAPANLRVTTELIRETLSTDENGLATAYSLIYEVRYQLNKFPPREFSLRRAFDYDAARELHAARESKFLEDDMRREAAARMLSQLSRIKF